MRADIAGRLSVVDRKKPTGSRGRGDAREIWVATRGGGSEGHASQPPRPRARLARVSRLAGRLGARLLACWGARVCGMGPPKSKGSRQSSTDIDWYPSSHTPVIMRPAPTIDNIKDSNANTILTLSPVASAVNDVQISNAAASSYPTLTAIGSDTHIGIGMIMKGAGTLVISVPTTLTPEEVAALVAFLAAEEAGFITGQVYVVDGGRMSKLSLP